MGLVKDDEVGTVLVTCTVEDVQQLKSLYDKTGYGILQHILILLAEQSNLELFDDSEDIYHVNH